MRKKSGGKVDKLASRATKEGLIESYIHVGGKVGVLLEVEPGWHVYWMNPGDSGAPTTVSLTLPPGFTAGPVRFPLRVCSM